MCDWMGLGWGCIYVFSIGASRTDSATRAIYKFWNAGCLMIDEFRVRTRMAE